MECIKTHRAALIRYVRRVLSRIGPNDVKDRLTPVPLTPVRVRARPRRGRDPNYLQRRPGRDVVHTGTSGLRARRARPTPHGEIVRRSENRGFRKNTAEDSRLEYVRRYTYRATALRKCDLEDDEPKL